VSVARIIVLDSGPLGDACRKRGTPDVEQLLLWWIQSRANGSIIAIPEIADYEVRRGLLVGGASGGVQRLDRLRDEHACYIPISTAAMRKAAELWADARRQGYPASADQELGCDSILAAQALVFSGDRDHLTVATYNPKHFIRHIDARPWQAITP
jgi:predicted nucleic acid-binding protein